MLRLRPSTLQVNAPIKKRQTAGVAAEPLYFKKKKSIFARFRTLKQLNWHVQPLWPLAPRAISLPPHLSICKLFVGSSRGEPFSLVFAFLRGEPGDSLVPDVRPPHLHLSSVKADVTMWGSARRRRCCRCATWKSLFLLCRHHSGLGVDACVCLLRVKLLSFVSPDVPPPQPSPEASTC